MSPQSRRHFLQRSALATAAFWIGGRNFASGQSPNGKLNIGIIGTANRAAGNIAGVQHENIVAVCDIDDTFLDAAMLKFPQAKRYNDFRKLLEQKDVDAVVVSTPDHVHGVAALAALKSGRHVYCEKPLAHNVREIRLLQAEAAKNRKLATQMGTQIHALENYRRAVELVRSGAIGKIAECHVWCEKSKTDPVPTEAPPVPPNVHWDLWLGPAKERPYHPVYHPKNWRSFWDFGGGTLGDMGCHYLDLAFWALDLTLPTGIVTEGPAVHAVTTPSWLIAHYEFPERKGRPPVKLSWYDGGKKPALATTGDTVHNWSNGVLFVGEKGMIIADYTRLHLLPQDKFKDFTPPPKSIPASVGHHEEWIRACKNGGPTTCNFAYSGRVAETVQLGTVAFRTGQKIEWDAAAMKVKNVASANDLLRREYRKGWEI